MRSVPMTKEEIEQYIQNLIRKSEWDERNEMFNRLSYEEIKKVYHRIMFIQSMTDVDGQMEEWERYSDEIGLKCFGTFLMDCDRRFPNIYNDVLYGDLQ